MRELHWHPNTDEWQYYIEGEARMTVFASNGKARTFDYQAGDVGYVPFAMGHYVENIGTGTLRFLELFRSDRFADISLAQWMALTPGALVQAHLNLDDTTMATLRREKQVVVSGNTPTSGSVLPEWPEGTVGVLSTFDGSLHAIPVMTVVRDGDRRILLGLSHHSHSLERLRAKPEVTLVILGGPGSEFTATGHACVIDESMPSDPEFAAVELLVESVSRHRAPGGLDVDVGVKGDLRALRERLAALQRLAR
jgi:oxalate decarboxylase